MPTPCIVLLGLAGDLKDFAPIKKFILAKPLFILFLLGNDLGTFFH